MEADCKTRVANDVTDAYYPLVDTASDCPAGTADGTTCLDRQTWTQALSAAFGSGACNVPYSPITSCHFYDMDNEPEIWDGPHRDIHPIHPGYTELSNLFEVEGDRAEEPGIRTRFVLAPSPAAGITSGPQAPPETTRAPMPALTSCPGG